MIVVVEQHNAHKHSYLIEKMFRLRARIFHHQLGWDVQVDDGKERDRLDEEGPVYIIYTDSSGCEVKGSLRLLPTTGPTLLADFFSDTCPDAVHLSAPTIWELTRFCFDDRMLDRDQEGILSASAVLMAALGDVAIRAGIKSIIGNCDASMLRLFRRLGCEVEVLGSTSRYGRPVYLGLHPVSEQAVRRVKKRVQKTCSVLAQTPEMAA